MAAFAEQQRRLLAAFGVRMSAWHSQALAYARSAISISLPAGSAVSAGYAFQQYRARGANQPVAAAVMLLAGVASVVGLALLYAGDALASAVSSGSRLAGTIGAATIAATAMTVALTRGRHDRVSAARSFDSDTPAADVSLRHPVRALRHLATLARAVTARQWLMVTGLALINWLADLACLLASLQAVGVAVPAFAVATAYVTVQLVRQVPVTPGGVGVVEASLFVGLTAAGASAAEAAAAVIIYRVLSCWAILPIGLVCWMAQRATEAGEHVEAAPPERPPSNTAGAVAVRDGSRPGGRRGKGRHR